MKIALVSGFYSEGMGYAENCLPRALASLGHEVHVITSDMNVYGNTPDYSKTYEAFLGPARVQPGVHRSDGYTVHRLMSTLLNGYVRMHGLGAKVRELRPEIVHSIEIASLQTFSLAAMQPLANFRLFTETHQHMSVVKPFLKTKGHLLKKLVYGATRTLPTKAASTRVQKCYAISPDCAEVAVRFYGVPPQKIKLQSLGADTSLFRPVETEADISLRRAMRSELGIADDAIVCVYTGRFSVDKNPLLLAQAIERLAARDGRFVGLFIGDGLQRTQIEACRNTIIRPFMTHRRLSEFYRMADIAVWPTQESMSMLDAAASGLPLVVSNKMGERERVEGNGDVFEEGSLEDLVAVLERMADAEKRRALGQAGRRKMVAKFSWLGVARSMEADFMAH
jgi:glycosyltransferase involved in cell wall biosynthesis